MSFSSLIEWAQSFHHCQYWEKNEMSWRLKEMVGERPLMAAMVQKFEGSQWEVEKHHFSSVACENLDMFQLVRALDPIKNEK